MMKYIKRRSLNGCLILLLSAFFLPLHAAKPPSALLAMDGNKIVKVLDKLA